MNIANKVTVARICFIPIYLFFMLNAKMQYHVEIGLAIFIVAALTDKLDGYLARSRHLVSDFGKFLDPLADKLLVTAAFLSLMYLGKIGAWPVFIVLFREFAVTGLRSIAAGQNIVIAASPFGKAKTVIQMVGIVIITVDTYIDGLLGFRLSDLFIVAIVLVTLLSGLDYFWKNRNVFEGKM